jgi:putative MATE family efflux protein
MVHFCTLPNIPSIMSQQSLRSENLFVLTWPVFLQHLTASVVLFVDFLFMSRLSDGIAATVGQVIPVTWLGSLIIPIFAGTGIAVASQFLGAGKHEKVVPTYMINLLFCMVMGIGIGLAMWLFRGSIGVWMGMTEQSAEWASLYLGLMSLYFVIMSSLFAYNAILSSRGYTNWLMVISLVSGVCNVVLNYLFVFEFGWGLAGIVWSTIIATVLSLGLSAYLVHVQLGIQFYLKGIIGDMRSVLRPILRIGIPNAVEPFSYVSQQIILSTFIISMGIEVMASNTYAHRMLIFHIIFSVALANGAQILMAHWMGAKKIEKIDRLYWKIVAIGMGFAAIYMFLIWINGLSVMSMFTNDPGIQSTAKQLLLVAVFMEPARVVNIISGSTLRCVGDSRYPMIVSVIFIWGILPIIFFIDAVWSLSIVGIWICFMIDEILRCGINLHRWWIKKWVHMGLVEEDSEV